MNRVAQAVGGQVRRMPHVCGDEPSGTGFETSNPFVCPTYVGMNRWQCNGAVFCNRMPHVGGDEPSIYLSNLPEEEYAPRMWG
mgnify:CR=1 FL=1